MRKLLVSFFLLLLLSIFTFDAQAQDLIQLGNMNFTQIRNQNSIKNISTDPKQNWVSQTRCDECRNRSPS